MKAKIKQVFVTVLFLSVLVLNVKSQDVVTSRTGNIYKGKIFLTSDDQSYSVTQADGITVTIPKSKVKTVLHNDKAFEFGDDVLNAVLDNLLRSESKGAGGSQGSSSGTAGPTSTINTTDRVEAITNCKTNYDGIKLGNFTIQNESNDILTVELDTDGYGAYSIMVYPHTLEVFPDLYPTRWNYRAFKDVEDYKGEKNRKIMREAMVSIEPCKDVIKVIK